MSQNDEQIHIQNQNSEHSSSNHKDKEAPENAKIPFSPKTIEDQSKEFFINDPQIHFIHCCPYIVKHTISNDHIILENKIVVTEYINGIPYSYLANPKNVDKKFYYITKDILSHTYKMTFPFRNDIFPNITVNKLNSFLSEINETVKKNNYHIVNDYFICKKSKCVLEYIGLITLLISVIIFITCPFVFEEIFLILICVGPILFVFGMTLMMVGRCAHISQTLKNGIEEKNITELKHLVHKWNQNYFLPNKIFISYPILPERNLPYLQINVDPNYKLEIEDHKLNN